MTLWAVSSASSLRVAREHARPVGGSNETKMHFHPGNFKTVKSTGSLGSTVVAMVLLQRLYIVQDYLHRFTGLQL